MTEARQNAIQFVALEGVVLYFIENQLVNKFS